MKKKISKIWLMAGIVAVVAIAAYLMSGGKKKEEISFTTVNVEKGNIQNTITATGTIEPVTSVSVGTQVSGIVSKLYVDYNSTVKRGQVIAELDKTNLESQLNSALANEQNAQANLQSAQATLNFQQSNYNRYQTLFNKGLVSANDYDRLASATSKHARLWLRAASR